MVANDWTSQEPPSDGLYGSSALHYRGMNCLAGTSAWALNDPIIGVALFIGCALIHQMVAQKISTEAFHKKIQSLHTKQDQIAKEFTSLRSDTTTGQAEVKLLQGLLQRVLKVETDLSEEIVANDEEPTHKLKEEVIGVDFAYADRDGKAPLDRLTITKILLEALKKDSVEMLLQPIVSLPQRKPRHYESYSRVRDLKSDTVITPSDYLSIAEDEDLIPLIDNTLLLRSIQLIRKAMRRNVHVDFFCNISIKTLSDEQFLGGFVDFIKDNQDLAKHLIFELHSIDLQQNKERSLELIQKLSPLGCSFSIDRLDPMSSWNLKELAQHNVRYIKIEAPLLLKVLDSDNAEKKFREFKAKADRLKIDVVISKVEEEKDLLQFLDYNFDYGQGYLFGTPQLSSA